MSQTYYALLTTVGLAKLANATALGTQLTIKKMAVGDGGGALPTPTQSQKALIGEKYRADLNALSVDPKNDSQIIAELVIPETTGGFWIREAGLYDAAGDLVAVSNTPPTYKPLLAEGSGRTQVIRIILVVSSTAAVELKIDPSVVLATRDYVDTAVSAALAKFDNKQSVRVATTGEITLSGLQTVDGTALAAGDRVLVKDNSAGATNGIYLAATGSWPRASDADLSAEVTPGLLVIVEEGVVNGNTLWELITDAPITLGVTPLAFAPIYNAAQVDAKLALKADLDSPVLVNKPTTQLPPQFDDSKRIASTQFVKRQGKQFGGSTSINGAGAVSASSAGQIIPLFGSAAAAIALPAATALPIGATLTFNCYNTVAANITANGTDVIYGLAAGQSVSVAVAQMLYGDVLELTVLGNTAGAGAWYVTGGNMTASAVVPRFDISQRPVSTKTLRDRGHEYSGYNGSSGSLTLTPAACGGITSMSAAAASAVTLPLTSACPVGATLTIVNTSTAAVTISAQTGDITTNQVGGTVALTLLSGDTAEFVRVGSEWRLVGGSLALGYANEFKTRSRAITGKLRVGGTPAANAALNMSGSIASFVAPCAGTVMAVAGINYGGTGTQPSAVTTNLRITGSVTGYVDAGEGTVAGQTVNAVMNVAKGETVTVALSLYSPTTNVAWVAVGAQFSFVFVPAN